MFDDRPSSDPGARDDLHDRAGDRLLNPADETDSRREDRTAVYSYERRHEARFEKEQRSAFRANKAAWDWFEGQSDAYRHLATFWVVSAKRPDTRARRLATLIECSAEGKRVPALTS